MVELEVIDPLNIWGPDVRAQLPSADEDAIVIEIENTANDFLRKSRTLDCEIEIALEANVATYDLNPVSVSWSPADTSFGGVYAMYVLYALYNERTLIHLNYKPKRPYPASSVVNFSYWCSKPAQVELFPTPTSANVSIPLLVRTSLTLSLPISNLPRFLADNYYEAILHGTIGRMMRHIKRPYYDKNGGLEHLRLYNNELRIAKDEAIRRWSSANAAFYFPTSWAFRSNNFMRT